MKMSADTPPQLFTKMAKKIAQLTKVVYTLSTRVEEQEALMLAMRELHQEDVKRITRDANDKLARCQTQVIRQVALLEQLSELEDALVRERQERCRLEGELGRRPSAGLAALCAELRDAGLALRSKLDAFERLQLHVELALEGVPESLPLESSRALAGIEAEDCVLRKNDFLRDHCDRLAVENSRMRNRFEDELGALRSFYEDSLCKLQGSRRLEVANDVSLVACSCCCNDRERLHALLRLLSSSEQQLDRYCKEIRALSDDLDKRDKQLKLMEDQASGREAELEQLAWRVKQSELALSQLRASSALDKQQANTDKMALLEAVASERESRLQQFEEEAQRLASLRDEGQKLREQLAVTETAVADYHKELLAKEQKNEELVRRLNTFKEESKCLKLIQAQLKEALLDSEERAAELSQALSLKTEEVNTKNGELQALWNDVKKLKWELTEDILEKEAMLRHFRRLYERKLFDVNTTWEAKFNISGKSAAQVNLEAQLDKQQVSLLHNATKESNVVTNSSSEKWDVRGCQLAFFSSFGKNNTEHSGELSRLKKAMHLLQESFDAASEELTSKKNELLKIRSEATQQIKNLELYWQRRITKELQDNCSRHEKEKEYIKENHTQELLLLTAKITALQKRQDGSVALDGPEAPGGEEEGVDKSAASPDVPPGALSPQRLGTPSLPPKGPLATPEGFTPALPPRTAKNKRSLWLLAQPQDPGRATTMLRRIVENVRHPK